MSDIKTNDSEVAAKTKVVAASKSEKKAKRSGGGFWSKILNGLQELGKALQVPVAVLPFAAILNRFGALGLQYATADSAGYWISFIVQTPGAVVFDNLPLMFAIGVAFGLAKDHRGEVALVSVIFYLILAKFTGTTGTLPEMIYKHVLTFKVYTISYDSLGNVTGTTITDHLSKLFYVKNFANDGKTIIGGAYVLSIGVLGGIASGCLSAFIYNRLKDIKLPAALSFFGGRRFVPMVAMVFATGVALIFAVVWPWIQYVLMLMGTAVANPENPAVAIPGTALYAFLNRILLPFGLHQILNTFFWFQLPIHGSVVAPVSGAILDPTTHHVAHIVAGAQAPEIWVNGDINAFTAGLSTAGLFQSGFFPVMMGGIPMIAVAMILTAKKENRKQVAGFLGGVAAVSFISGITEPIEFSFVFISPLLLVIHACLTAGFVAATTAMHIQIGFGFSAGLIDYCVSFAQSWGMSNFQTGAYHVTSNPLWTLALIGVCGVTYFFVFFFTIKGLNLMTPGREEVTEAAASEVAKIKASKPGKGTDKYENMARVIIDTIGEDNLVKIDNCTTRLRLIVKDNSTFSDAPIKAVGAFGVKRLGTESVQVVIGTDVEHVSSAMKRMVNK